MKTFNFKKASPTVLRVGIALVVLWFAFQQITNPNAWIGLIPAWVMSLSGLSALALVHINAAFELVFGLALLVGWYTQVTALLLSLHLIHITLTVGYGAIGVRDFGLAMAAVSIFLHGSDAYSIDARSERSSVMMENKG